MLDPYSQWNHVRDDLFSLIENFDDGDLDFKPFPTSWSVKEIILHIAIAEEGWFQYVVQGNYTQWPDAYPSQEFSSINAIKKKLAEVHQLTMEEISTLTVEDFDRDIQLTGVESY